MAASNTKEVTDLKSIFNSVNNVYFKKAEIKTSDLSGEGLTYDMELPILSDGVSFNTGEPDVTEVKLTTQRIWSRVVKKGDSDISFNVASVSDDITALLMKKVASSTVTGKAGAVVAGKTYSGSGFSLDPQTITGALVMVSEDKGCTIVLPWVQIVSSLNAADGDNPAYFQCKVTPCPNSDSVDIYILNEAGE